MKRIMVVIAVAAICATQADAQNRGGFGCRLGQWDNDFFWHPYGLPESEVPWVKNTPYDGRFTWVRIMYSGNYKCQQEGPGWAHDFNRSDVNLMQIMDFVTNLKPHTPETNILRLDDPELMKFPVAYLSEPGGMFATQSPKEEKGLRDYLTKGGFLIVDDFPGTTTRGDPSVWWYFVATMKRILPNATILPIEADHPVFDSFFRVDKAKIINDIANAPTGYYGVPEFYGIFEDNDPTKRLMVAINYSCDLGEFMEFSKDGVNAVDINNEIYKLGVNYIVYAMTH